MVSFVSYVYFRISVNCKSDFLIEPARPLFVLYFEVFQVKGYQRQFIYDPCSQIECHPQSTTRRGPLTKKNAPSLCM